MTSDAIPPALADAVSRKRLLVLCGAGVSMLPPSNLPSWWGFNQSILDEAKRLTLEGFPDLDERAKEKIGALSLHHLSVVSFSEMLVSTFAGSNYFPVLEILDSDQTNANHWALAELGRLRIASVFITTNFDTLIERSFRQAAVPLQVYADEKDYVTDDVEGSDCELYKIHGTVKSVTSLIDSVTQKLRGIPLEVRDRLVTLFRNYHVLVVGYSGADLEFGNDYIALTAIDEHCPGITWVMRPDAQPSERVRRVVERAGARGGIVEATLPDFFENLGIAVTRPPSGVAETSRAAAESRARERIREFFAQPYVGVFSSASFCVNLLRNIGEELTVESLLKSLAAHPQISGREVHMSAAIAYNALSSWALHKHKFSGGGLLVKPRFGTSQGHG